MSSLFLLEEMDIEAEISMKVVKGVNAQNTMRSVGVIKGHLVIVLFRHWEFAQFHQPESGGTAEITITLCFKAESKSGQWGIYDIEWNVCEDSFTTARIFISN